MACILDRDRHKELIAKVREAGARIMLISDGDITGVVATATARIGDRHLPRLRRRAGRRAGGGGAALHRRSDAGPADVRERGADAARARDGHHDPQRKFTLEEMAKGDVMFACTGVTSGTMLRGVKRFGHGAITHSMVMRSKSGTVRFVEAHHNFATKTWLPTGAVTPTAD